MLIEALEYNILSTNYRQCVCRITVDPHSGNAALVQERPANPGLPLFCFFRFPATALSTFKIIPGRDAISGPQVSRIRRSLAPLDSVSSFKIKLPSRGALIPCPARRKGWNGHAYGGGRAAMARRAFFRCRPC